MLHEMQMLGEIIVFAVFKDKNAIFLQQLLFKNQVRNLWQLLQGVRRISKDEVKLLVATLDETEHITSNALNTLSCVQLIYTLLNKTMMVTIQFYTHHLSAATRQQFQRDAACAREKVKGRGTIEIDVTRQHVEDILLCKVRRRACLECARNIKMPTLIFPCDNSHIALGFGLKADS